LFIITDCKDIYDAGNTTNGVYTITPQSGLSFDVFCDMDDGGWIVVQNRYNGHENFIRTWSEYINGFGDLNSEFWIGLDKIYNLTNSKSRSVKFDLQTTNGVWINGTYGTFYIESELMNYELHVSNFTSGNLDSYSFTYNNGKSFYTYDHDNVDTCATRRYGGWWYGDCTYLNINGKYGVQNDESGMIEHHSGYNNLQATKMKIR